MRLLKPILLVLLIGLLAFVAHTLISTGFFRSITPHFEGEILRRVSLKGAEDITISQADSFALLSATDRRVFPADAQEVGELYYFDLKTPSAEPLLLTGDFDQPFAPHGISFFPKDSGYRVMAINHTPENHPIEVFDLYGRELKHVESLVSPELVHPNDLVMVDENRFFVTNDHKYTAGLGKLVEEYGGLALCNVLYYDGADYQEVANGIAYANGINFDPQRKLLYVASPRAFLVKVYELKEEGALTFVEDIPCGTGVDNIELDEEGNLWIGAHPNLLRFNAYAKGNRETAPSELLKVTYHGPGDYEVEAFYVEEGDVLSASTVAAPFGKKILAGSVFDEEFLVLELPH